MAEQSRPTDELKAAAEILKTELQAVRDDKTGGWAVITKLWAQAVCPAVDVYVLHVERAEAASERMENTARKLNWLTAALVFTALAVSVVQPLLSWALSS